MKCIVIEPISLNDGVRREPGSEVDVDGEEYLKLSKLGCIEPSEVASQRNEALSRAAKMRADADAEAAKVVAAAEDSAKAKAAEAEAKAGKGRRAAS